MALTEAVRELMLLNEKNKARIRELERHVVALWIAKEHGDTSGNTDALSAANAEAERLCEVDY